MSWRLKYTKKGPIVINAKHKVLQHIVKFKPKVLIPISDRFTLYIGKDGKGRFHLGGIIWHDGRWDHNLAIELDGLTDKFVRNLVRCANKNRCCGLAYVLRKFGVAGLCRLTGRRK